MSDFRKAFDAGRSKAKQVIRESAILGDPAGLESQRPKLRSLGKWRFILIRGILGFGAPFSLWLVLSHLSEEINFAHFHQSVLGRLLQEVLFALCMCTFMGFIVGLLAWRRIVSERLPSEPPDPEAYTTTLGLF